MYNTLEINRKDRNKGARVSFFVHALLLLLIFFYYLPKVDPAMLEDKPPYAVKVDFTFEESSLSKLAHDDAGARRAKAESAPKAEEKPQEETPQKEEIVKPEEIEITKPQIIDIPRPDIKVPNPVIIPTDNEPIVTSRPAEEAPVKVSEPAKPSAPEPVKTAPATSSSTSGSGSTTGSSPKPSTVEGAGGPGKADAGTGAGRDKGNDGNAGSGNTSEGTGEYDGSGDGVFGRKIVYRDLSAAKAAVTVSGKVVTKVCINRAGIVTFVELIPSSTTIRDNRTLKLYMKAARGYKFQPDLTAPKEQCGKLSFIVDNTVNNQLKSK